MKVFILSFRFFLLLDPVQPIPLDRNLQRETSSSDMDRDGQDDDVMKMVDKMIVELDQTSTREKLEELFKYLLSAEVEKIQEVVQREFYLKNATIASLSKKVRECEAKTVVWKNELKRVLQKNEDLANKLEEATVRNDQLQTEIEDSSRNYKELKTKLETTIIASELVKNEFLAVKSESDCVNWDICSPFIKSESLIMD